LFTTLNNMFKNEAWVFMKDIRMKILKSILIQNMFNPHLDDD